MEYKRSFYPRPADSISLSVGLSVCLSVCRCKFLEKFQISLMAPCDPSLTTYDPLRPYVGSLGEVGVVMGGWGCGQGVWLCVGEGGV